jgi:hypothetical protein
MRTIALVLLLLLVARSGYAQPIPTPAQQRYAQEKKSAALAVTLEALCPIAGAGALYAGETDRVTFLAILSTVAAGAGVGSVFWLIHLDHEHPSGASRYVVYTEQGAAISLLVTAAVFYLIARASGLVLASEATTSFNLELQQRLGVSPDAGVAVHALAPGPALVFRF